MLHSELIHRHCLQILTKYLCKHILIGFSGGRDSHVLLHTLAILRQQKQLQCKITAIHVNHQLQSEASQWVEHCQVICEQLDLELIVETVTKSPTKGESIEAFARTHRYKLIEPHIQRGGSFVSAHHQRDQAETFLLQLMRGAGLDGLRSMPLVKPFGCGQYIRPLLDCNYQDIIEYADRHKLIYINDSSNENRQFDRNYIRHEVLPILTTRFPQAERSIARSATWLSEVPNEPVADELSTPTLTTLSTEQQKLCIRNYVKSKTGISISHTKTDYIVQHHLTAAADKHPKISVENYEIRRWQNKIIITEQLPTFPDNFLFRINVGVGKTEKFDNFAIFDWKRGIGGIASGQYQIKPLRGSDRFHPHNRGHRSTVKKLLLEKNIAPWLRVLTPGLYDGDALIAIPGIGVAKSHFEKNQNAMMPQWIIKQKFVKL